MSDPVEALVLDLLEWIGPGAKPYAEVMAAWRTSCPRLPVWEVANARGLLVHGQAVGAPAWVRVSAAGFAHLQQQRQHAAGQPPSAQGRDR